MIMLVDSEDPDQNAQMRKLIWAFPVRIICLCWCFTAQLTE